MENNNSKAARKCLNDPKEMEEESTPSQEYEMQRIGSESREDEMQRIGSESREDEMQRIGSESKEDQRRSTESESNEDELPLSYLDQDMYLEEAQSQEALTDWFWENDSSLNFSREGNNSSLDVSREKNNSCKDLSREENLSEKFKDAREVDRLLNAAEGGISESNEQVDGFLPNIPLLRGRQIDKSLRIRFQNIVHLTPPITQDQIPQVQISIPSSKSVTPNDSDHEDFLAPNLHEGFPVNEIASVLIGTPLVDNEIANAPVDVPLDEIANDPTTTIVSSNNPVERPPRSIKICKNTFLWILCIFLMIILGVVIHMWTKCYDKKYVCLKHAASASAIYIIIAAILGFLIMNAWCFRR